MIQKFVVAIVLVGLGLGAALAGSSAATPTSSEQKTAHLFRLHNNDFGGLPLHSFWFGLPTLSHREGARTQWTIAPSTGDYVTIQNAATGQYLRSFGGRGVGLDHRKPSGSAYEWQIETRADGSSAIRSGRTGRYLDADHRFFWWFRIDLSRNPSASGSSWTVKPVDQPPTATTTPTPTSTPTPTATTPPTSTPTPTPIPPFGTLAFTLYSDQATPTNTSDDAPITDGTGEWQLLDTNDVQVRSGAANPATTITDLAVGTYWLLAVANEHPEVRFGPFEIAPGDTADAGELLLAQTGFGGITFTLYTDAETPSEPSDDVPITDGSGNWILLDASGAQIQAGDASPSATVRALLAGTYSLRAVANEHPEVVFGPFDVIAGTTVDLGRLVLADTTPSDTGGVSFTLNTDAETPTDTSDDVPIVDGTATWKLLSSDNVPVRSGGTSPTATLSEVPTGTYQLIAAADEHPEVVFGPFDIEANQTLDLGNLLLFDTTPTPPTGLGQITFTLYSDAETPTDTSDDFPITDGTGEWALLDANDVQVRSGEAAPSATITDLAAGIYWLRAVADEHAEVRFGPFEVEANATLALGNLLLFDRLFDADGDFYPDNIDCAPHNPAWGAFADSGDVCSFGAWTNCATYLRVVFDCLPPVTDVDAAFAGISRRMSEDEHAWRYRLGRRAEITPGDSFGDATRHLQAIQVFDTFTVGYPNNGTDGIYLVSTLAAGSDGKPAVQLVRTSAFGSSAGQTDWIADQFIFPFPYGRFDHPGGAQMIGDLLFVALEDSDSNAEPITAVLRIRPQNPEGSRIELLYTIKMEWEGVANNGKHTAVAVTKLNDGRFLMAACVQKTCRVINFYKSEAQQPDYVEGGQYAPRFEFVDQWLREELPPGTPFDAGCGVQNLSFVPAANGELHLAMFGSTTADITLPEFALPDELEFLDKLRYPICGALIGYDDHLFVYEVDLASSSFNYTDQSSSFEISLGSGRSFDIMENRLSSSCSRLLAPNPVPELPDVEITTRPGVDGLHGVNGLAAAGLFRPYFGSGELGVVASEHYDTCDDPFNVNGNTRWAVSSNAR